MRLVGASCWLLSCYSTLGHAFLRAPLITRTLLHKVTARPTLYGTPRLVEQLDILKRTKRTIPWKGKSKKDSLKGVQVSTQAAREQLISALTRIQANFTVFIASEVRGTLTFITPEDIDHVTAVSNDLPKGPYVYLLTSSDQKATYVGATVDLSRRLRQHNRVIKGGAKATACGTWERVCFVCGFPDWSSALQFEWRWKRLTRIQSTKLAPLERRSKALALLLALDRSTSKAKPYIEWETPPVVHIE